MAKKGLDRIAAKKMDFFCTNRRCLFSRFISFRSRFHCLWRPVGGMNFLPSPSLRESIGVGRGKKVQNRLCQTCREF